jgi:hypothetical protein
MADPQLLILDADRIHEYVFAPRQLKAIRGGSAIQAKLNRSLIQPEAELLSGGGNVDSFGNVLGTPTLADGAAWEAVYAGGGTALILFRSPADAERYRIAATRLYAEETSAATASAAFVPYWGAFKENYDGVRRQLERAKSARSEHIFAAGNPYWKVCETCGRYPAAHRHRDPGRGELLACAACLKRLENSVRSPYLVQVSCAAGTALKPPRDFESIAARSVPENYLAVVYLDINRLGRFLAERASTSVAEFRDYSTAVHKAVVQGTVAGCAAAARRAGGEEAPFEILLIGGDDAIVVMRAQDVFVFLREFHKVFQAEPLLNITDNTLDFSVGIVWAHQHFPISHFLTLAEELLKSAKRRSGGGFAADYLIVTEAMAGKIGPRGEGGSRKPYALPEFLALEKSVAAWKSAGVPRGKVQDLYRIAQLPTYQATLEYHFLLSRLEPTHRDRVKRLGLAGMADLVELWDFVEAQ